LTVIETKREKIILIKNVGKIDRTLRFLLGLFVMNGKEGDIIGILVATISLIPFYMTFTVSCFVFRWFKTHSLSKKECEIYGPPYSESKERDQE